MLTFSIILNIIFLYILIISFLINKKDMIYNICFSLYIIKTGINNLFKFIKRIIKNINNIPCIH